ncbi:MAG: nucleoside-diphosphate sugar epimerase/dehydratase, partial [Sideroxydans sp.]
MLGELRPNIRTSLALLHDTVAAAVAWVFAYLLRFNFDIPNEYLLQLSNSLLWVVPFQLLVFWQFRLYRGAWRYASLSDLRQILVAIVFAAAAVPLVLWMGSTAVAPRSVLVIDPILLILMMGGSRLVYRVWKEQGLHGVVKLGGEPVLILGAGDAAVNLSKELLRGKELRLVGFLDDDVDSHERTLNGIRVLGGLDGLKKWTDRFGVRQVIIAMPKASHQQRKRAIELCAEANVKALTVPSFEDLLSGRVTISQLRAVELEDLLGRDAVQLDDAGLREQLAGKVVMVTGAGGSIGSELCRQIARFSPRALVLYEANEFALYTIEQELGQLCPNLDIVYLAGDVRDKARLSQVFGLHRPSVVFHAAAYKHVPLMEKNNAWQAVRNNIFGTWQVARCAQEFGAEKFVLISTDKAVNPTNVMGASKRMAEMVCQGLQHDISLSQRGRAGVGVTQFIIVRFGNVLGSNGSVIPKFREQISKGGPITVTHPEITRFFMSIPEAAQLVMQAGYMGKGGEIFVLEMGEPVKIVDLARDMIRLSGFNEDDIKIEFIGL